MLIAAMHLRMIGHNMRRGLRSRARIISAHIAGQYSVAARPQQADAPRRKPGPRSEWQRPVAIV